MPAKIEHEPLFTRKEAADYCKVTVQEFRRRENCGYIVSCGDGARGLRLYKQSSIEEMLSGKTGWIGRRGQAAARTITASVQVVKSVFAELQGGATLLDIVMKLDVMPDQAVLIAEAYAKVTNTLFVSHEIMERINRLPLEGDFPLKSDAELFDVLRKTTEDACRRCSKNARLFCKKCASAWRRDVQRRKIMKPPMVNGQRSMIDNQEQAEQEDPEEVLVQNLKKALEEAGVEVPPDIASPSSEPDD